MDTKIQAPKRISALLTLMTSCALIIVIFTLGLVAIRLAIDFDSQARNDAVQRVERGLSAMTDRLTANSVDYANWTDHYLALHNNDRDWLDENIGLAVQESGVAQLVILGGDPLRSAMGWVSDEFGSIVAEEYAETLDIVETHIAELGLSLDDLPYPVFSWIGGELWLLTIDRVLPHTALETAHGPASIMVFGVTVPDQISRYLADTILLSDVRLQSSPGDLRASYMLPIIEGRPAWLVWTLPNPGTNAIASVMLPVSLTMGLLLVVVGAGVYALRRTAADLEYALIRAEAGSKAKSEFLANMSHEIRTPLNGVLGMAELMSDTRLEKSQREMLETIRTSGVNLLSLINDILDLARVESGKMSLESRPFKLDEMLERLESLHGAMAHARGLKLVVRRNDGPTEFRIGDETRVMQILHNVVGNAIKFTEKGTITVDVDVKDQGQIVFRIQDTGIGMTEDEVTRYFLPFEQADASTTRRFGGTGLGMSITRRLIEAMEGSISVNSVPEQGTEVVIRLCIPALSQAAEPLGRKSEQDGLTAAEIGTLKGYRVLVAEDNATNRKILALMLSKLGVQVQFAENGAEACALWHQDRFDLVLMDISMPVMDGFAALQSMQRSTADSGLPPPTVIAATANVMTDHLESYKTAGFVDVLPKPIKRADLEHALFRHIRPSTPAQ